MAYYKRKRSSRYGSRPYRARKYSGSNFRRKRYGGRAGYGKGRSIRRLGGFAKEKVEKKFVDTYVTAAQMDSAGTLGLLNGVTQGDDYNERVGREIHMKSLDIRGGIQPQDAQVVDNFARLIVVMDKQANGAAPNGADILDVSTIAAAFAWNNLNNKDRFVILADKTYMLGGQDLTPATAGNTWVQPPTIAKVKIHIKLNTPLTFLGTTNGIGSISTNSIYLFTVGTAAPNTGHTFIGATRMRFTDC